MTLLQTQPVRSAEEFVRHLYAVGPDDISLAHIDGCSGRELLQLIPGFRVEATSYTTFVVDTGLEDRIAHLLHDLDLDDEEAVNQAAADIQLGIAATWIPQTVRAAIIEGYAALTGGDETATVAVRASAPGLDTPLEALTRFNDTSHSARGTSAVLNAVRRCWASAFSARAIIMRGKLGFPHARRDIAVIVQRQVGGFRVAGLGHSALGDARSSS